MFSTSFPGSLLPKSKEPGNEVEPFSGSGLWMAFWIFHPCWGAFKMRNVFESSWDEIEYIFIVKNLTFEKTNVSNARVAGYDVIWWIALLFAPKFHLMTGRFDSEKSDQDEVLIERYIPCLLWNNDPNITPTLNPGSFLLGKKDPGRRWSRDLLKSSRSRDQRLPRIFHYTKCKI